MSREAQDRYERELGAFMHALGYVESRNNYDATGPYTGARYGRAKGRYQIMSAIYPAWAREAGVDPADYSPAAQDKVARFKMGQYYRQYGSWALVAVAWFAGPARAAKAKRDGISSVAGIKDVLGTSVSSYVNKVMAGMNNTPATPTERANRKAEQDAERRRPQPPRTPTTPGTSLDWVDESGMGEAEGGGVMAPPAPAMTPMEMQTAADQMNSDGLAQILGTISQAASAQGGGRILDLKNLLGLPPSEPVPVTIAEAPAPAVEQPEQQAGQAQPDEGAQPTGDGKLAPPPKHKGFTGLTDTAKSGTQRLMGAFPGLRFTSGLRDPAHNASVGGVKTSKHLTGQASDFVGTEDEMQRAAAWAKAQGAKVLVHDSGSGRHLHIEWP